MNAEIFNLLERWRIEYDLIHSHFSRHCVFRLKPTNDTQCRYVWTFGMPLFGMRLDLESEQVSIFVLPSFGHSGQLGCENDQNPPKENIFPN